MPYPTVSICTFVLAKETSAADRGSIEGMGEEERGEFEASGFGLLSLEGA